VLFLFCSAAVGSRTVDRRVESSFIDLSDHDRYLFLRHLPSIPFFIALRFSFTGPGLLSSRSSTVFVCNRSILFRITRFCITTSFLRRCLSLNSPFYCPLLSRFALCFPNQPTPYYSSTTDSLFYTQSSTPSLIKPPSSSHESYIIPCYSFPLSYLCMQGNVTSLNTHFITVSITFQRTPSVVA
jgi:hypothetical protein